MTTLQGDARKASYERAVDDARQTVENWILNTEPWYDQMRAIAREDLSSDASKCQRMRGRVYMFMASGIIGAHGQMERARFTSANYMARRDQIDTWYGDMLDMMRAAARRDPQAPYARTYEDACGLARDLAMNGVWLADDGDLVSADTILDAVMLALNTCDWQWLLDYLRAD